VFKIKQIIVRLEDDIHQSLKLKTIQDGVSIQGFVKEIIESYVNGNITADELVEKIKK
jgi:predicted HicB family RNase H-like nuclease